MGHHKTKIKQIFVEIKTRYFSRRNNDIDHNTLSASCDMCLSTWHLPTETFCPFFEKPQLPFWLETVTLFRNHSLFNEYLLKFFIRKF